MEAFIGISTLALIGLSLFLGEIVMRVDPEWDWSNNQEDLNGFRDYNHNCSIPSNKVL